MGDTGFGRVGLADDSSDRETWRFAQQNRMTLLTDNRNMKGRDSLEQTLREESTAKNIFARFDNQQCGTSQ